MSETCCPSGAERSVCALPAIEPRLGVCTICPDCAVAGRPVQEQTVKALLAVSLRAVGGADYLFCRTPDCAVVYFAADGSHAFTTRHLRERVYQKARDQADVFVCYCFRYSVGDLRGATAEGRAAIVAAITAGIHAGQCACDLRNPQGACCLGNVRTLIQQLAEVNKLRTELL